VNAWGRGIAIDDRERAYIGALKNRHSTESDSREKGKINPTTRNT
jgi:hypothetical protein